VGRPSPRSLDRGGAGPTSERAEDDKNSQEPPGELFHGEHLPRGSSPTPRRLLATAVFTATRSVARHDCASPSSRARGRPRRCSGSLPTDSPGQPDTSAPAPRPNYRWRIATPPDAAPSHVARGRSHPWRHRHVRGQRVPRAADVPTDLSATRRRLGLHNLRRRRRHQQQRPDQTHRLAHHAGRTPPTWQPGQHRRSADRLLKWSPEAGRICDALVGSWHPARAARSSTPKHSSSHGIAHRASRPQRR
jgi:hypothetical protein